MSGTTELTRVIVIVLIVGNVLAFAVGLSLLIAPRQIAKWFGLKSTHPLSIRRLTKPLERTRDSERVMLRYPRLLGSALLLGGLFVLLKWAFFVGSLSVADGGRMLGRLFIGTAWSTNVWESLWVTALAVVLLGALLAIILGGLALIRVQTLKSFSSLANKWVSTRRAAKPVSRPYYGIDRLIAERPQLWGGVITLLSLYTLIMIVWATRGLM